MITPAFSPTATERVLPRLALDFTTASLDPRVTVTRALNTATRVNSSGYIETVNANLPRFDYDPVTLACKGLLIEESRTNICLRSDDFTSGGWYKPSITVTANAIASPDGTTNADKLEASGPATVVQDVTSTGTTASYTVYAKQGSGVAQGARFLLRNGTTATNLLGILIDYSNGSFIYTVGSSGATVTNAGNGWWRICLSVSTGISVGDVLSAYVGFTGGGSAGHYMYAWGAQVEAGAFATSYIPTTSASVTRNADVVAMTGTNFSSWFNASEGTFVTNIQKLSPSSVATYAYEVTGATSSFSMRVRLGTDARMQSVDGGSVQVDAQIAGSVPTTISKYAMAYKLNSYAGAANGAAAVSDTTATVPALSTLNLGSVAVTNLYLRNFNYYPQRLINNEVQAFSK